jgi:hypothetical protein
MNDDQYTDVGLRLEALRLAVDLTVPGMDYAVLADNEMPVFTHKVLETADAFVTWLERGEL